MAEYDRRIAGSPHTALQNRLSGTAQRTAAGSAGVHSSAPAQEKGFSSGQIIRGQVIDLRNHEVKVQLDDSRVLSGRIDDAASLSIGERAVFQVTRADPRTIALKVISDPRAASRENTIDKALEAASLPKSERNVSAVRALLEQGLSVDKNSIQNLLRQSASLRGISFRTLAILQKQQIPATQVNASQLERYLNYEHRIANLAEQTASELSEAVFSAANADSGDAARLNGQLLRLLLPQSADAASASALPLSSLGLLSSDELLNLLDTLEQFGLSADNGAALLNGTATLQETAHLLLQIAEQLDASQAENTDAAPDAEGSSSAGGADGAPSGITSLGSAAVSIGASTVSGEAAENSGTSAGSDTICGSVEGGAAAESGAGIQTTAEGAALGQATTGSALSLFRSLLHGAGSIFGGKQADNTVKLPPQTVPFAEQTLSGLLEHLPAALQTPEIYTLLNAYAAAARGSMELSAMLPKRLRTELADHLKGKLSQTVLQKVKDGELTAAQLLKLLMESSDSGQEGSSYLSSEAYRELLRQWLSSRLTMRPEDLSRPGAVADYYDSLDRALASLEKLPGRTDGQPAFQDTAAGIRDNIDFMKALNQLFPYVQLPLRLSGRSAHAELFVYTDRERTMDAASGVRALLHLDMEQLGPLDIHLVLEQKKLRANFYLTDAAGSALAEENLASLTGALAAKGYTLDARVQTREAFESPVSAMLAPKQDSTSMKRYTFDIRA